MYFLKQKGQDIPIKIGGVLSKAGASSIIYHLEDNDDLVYKEYNEIKEAQDQIHKLKYFIKNPPTQELEPINHW